jgi:hypothetical protein
MSGISNINDSILQSQLTGLQVQQQISVKVAAKTLDVARDQGAAVLDLLDSAMQAAQADNSAPPTLGQLVTGKGMNLDVYA